MKILKKNRPWIGGDFIRIGYGMVIINYLQ
jgi:hypothetical protein